MKSLLLIFIGLLCLVNATHFRFGTMTWKIPNLSQPNTVQFQLECIFRYSYFTQLKPPVTPTVGGQVNFAVADKVNELQFGDGHSVQQVLGTVQSIDMVNDAFTAIWTGSNTYTGFTNGQVFNAYFKSYARLATLLNNPNANYSVSTAVTLFTNGTINSSPVSSSLPIIPATINTINHIRISASDAESSVTFALSTPVQQGQANSTQPPAYSIDATSGIITWNTNGLAIGLYNSQIRITDTEGAYTVLDFLLNLTAASSVPPPMFIAPSPADGALLTAMSGSTFTQQICASDSVQSITVSLQAGSLPAGVTFSPPLGTLNNPVCTTLSWTPTAGQAGTTYSFPFEADIASGGSASLTFSIKVPALPTPVPTDMPSPMPTIVPTDMPTPMPTDMPTPMPTPMPTDMPTPMPTPMPTDMPTPMPTPIPTDMPTPVPTPMPTGMPTGMPTPVPTPMPTGMPTPMPTSMPTGMPTAVPSPTPAPFCGDNMCQMSENCATCPADCNKCPQVIYNRAITGSVVTATSFGAGATINLTTYAGTSRPSAYQAWTYDTTTNRIQLCENGLILGAGPVAQNQPLTEHHISWNFKAALNSISVDFTIAHEFPMIQVMDGSNPPWYYLQDKLFNGNGVFSQASCLMAPYTLSPANPAYQEVWGPNCKTTNFFQWQFVTYVCPNGVPCGC